MSKLQSKSIAKAIKRPSSPINSEISDSESDSESCAESDVESKQRRKPTKKSRSHYPRNEHLLSLSMATSVGRTKKSVETPSAAQNNCDGCVIKASNNIKLQAKTHEIEKLHKSLLTSYMNIETEMLMAYVLFFTVAPYLLYSGIKYDNRALLSIGIVLLLYAITNIFMLLCE